jgi:hypothetical protein
MMQEEQAYQNQAQVEEENVTVSEYTTQTNHFTNGCKFCANDQTQRHFSQFRPSVTNLLTSFKSMELQLMTLKS